MITTSSGATQHDFSKIDIRRIVTRYRSAKMADAESPVVTVLTVLCLQMVFLIVVLLLVSSCGSESRPDGGPCAFAVFPGTALFTEIKPAANGVEAHFDFTLTDPTVTVTYLANNGRDYQLTDNTGRLLTAEWLASNGISAGVQAPAEYKEIRSGTCAPWFISFPTFTNTYGHP
jgi:hypothetical protein